MTINPLHNIKIDTRNAVNKKITIQNICLLILSYSSLINASHHSPNSQPESPTQFCAQDIHNAKTYLDKITNQEIQRLTKPLMLPQDLYDALYQAQEDGNLTSKTMGLSALMKLMPYHTQKLNCILSCETIVAANAQKAKPYCSPKSVPISQDQ